MKGILLAAAIRFGSLDCEASDARCLAGMSMYKELAGDDFGVVIAVGDGNTS